MSHADYTDTISHGWSGGKAITKWWRGSFVHLYRLTKPCAQCGGEITIDVTRAALNGTAKNHGLLLQRCIDCRESSKAHGGTSRPRISKAAVRATVEAESVTAVTVVDNTKLEELRTELAEVTRERDEAWEANVNGMVERGKLVRELEAIKSSDLFKMLQAANAELATLRKRLAQFELPAAMAAQQANGFDPHKALAEEIAKKKMPWS